MADKITAEDQDLETGDPNPQGEGGAAPPPKIEGAKDEDANLEIPVRRSAAQHIIARQAQKIEKLRSKVDEDDDFQPPKPEGDEGELTPEAAGAVQRVVQETLRPVLDTLGARTDEDELQDLYGREEGAQKYDKKIRAYMKSPHYRGVAPEVIYHHLAFEEAAESGRARGEAADHEARQARGGGRPARPTGSTSGIPSADEQNEMTDEQFEELQNKARSGDFVKE